jgi:hypothetical protein
VITQEHDKETLKELMSDVRATINIIKGDPLRSKVEVK